MKLECPYGKTVQCAVLDDTHVMPGKSPSQSFCLGCGTLTAQVFIALVQKYKHVVDMPRIAKITVHVLMGGQPLCMFTTDLPKDWPEGHAWSGIEDASHNPDDISCEHCRVALVGVQHG